MVNREFAAAVGYAGNVSRLASLIGVSRQTMHDQYKRGFVSNTVAEKIVRQFPQLDELQLMKRPTPEAEGQVCA